VEGLLARGIAISPRGPRTVVLPSLRGYAQRHRTPQRNKLGRILSAVFVLAALIYGVVIGGQGALAYAKLWDGIEAVAVAAGFGVKEIIVEGQDHVTDADVTKALEAGPATMMLGFDTDSAKARLESLPWIRHAQVMRLLPSTLRVVIDERKPFAVWQLNGRTYVVDSEGTLLAPAVREAYADLPLIVGEGAGQSAPELFTALKPYDALRNALLASIRVGDRRWTLKLASGTEILLPDDNVADALETYANVEHDRGLIGKDVGSVDLRLADRITMKLRDAAAPTTSPATLDAIPSDVPTAATKRAPVKGNT
jgi:cell division protein FtsQ